MVIKQNEFPHLYLMINRVICLTEKEYFEEEVYSTLKSYFAEKINFKSKPLYFPFNENNEISAVRISITKLRKKLSYYPSSFSV